MILLAFKCCCGEITSTVAAGTLSRPYSTGLFNTRLAEPPSNVLQNEHTRTSERELYEAQFMVNWTYISSEGHRDYGDA